MNNPYVARVIAYSFLAILLLSAGAAYATCKDKKCTTPSQPQPTSSVQSTLSATQTSLSESHSAASSAANSIASAGSAYGGMGGSVSDSSNFYVLPGPVAGSNLPAGICQRSQYRHFSFGWNFVSSANGDSFTDMECMHAVLAVQKARYEAANPPRLPPMTACERKQYKAVVAKKKPRVCK